ncbi:TonB-dependent receptor domain-containing protein [Sphingomonas xinjiangensis]|uniref:Outer membrane receptor protein involved in Fe transport n=1 Tax=Sphingomonas xinjiangensis TaxID=643568 RepID=A0A840YNW9_9SPHN|nr:TonB-dependent receptor [Sphingomonas xinjiangensis]MBB5708943.1 outer membrane receptor protein involved in Fe transport [Sphingomonas xinjiangensis]
MRFVSMGSRSRLSLTASLAVLAIAAANPAAAQDASDNAGANMASGTDTTATDTAVPPIGDAAAAPSSTQAEPAQAEEVVVTGSRISRPTLDSPIPVTSVSIADLTRTGGIVLGDALNDLPSLRSTYSQANSTQYIGTSGLNILDLRGLGPSRTLVLVNGRRHITSQEGEFLVDTNTIPTDLIDRVDIVTGGSSAVYGSDAMAGVVNFVLKRDFEGARLNAQAGLSDKGDRGSYRLSSTFGKNFAEGRGNVALSLEYNQANLVTYTDRPELTGAFSGRNQFQLVNTPSSDNSIPDRTFLTGVRSFGYDNGGNFIAYNGTRITACGTQPGGCLPNGRPRIYGFNTDGSLSEYNYGTDFRPVGSGNNQGGSGAILNDRGTLVPQLNRYVANFLGHYDVSDAFRPFIEAKFVRVESFNQGTPTFAQGGEQGLVDDVDAAGVAVRRPANLGYGTSTGIPIQFDNAFLQPGAAATIRSLLPAGANFFRMNRNNNDLGTRDEFDRRDTYRVVVGAEGTFNDDWKYDISANYGEFRSTSKFYNNRIEQNFYNAVDSVRNGAGQIVCRINQAAVTDPNCVPINLFGNGSPSQAALNYINTTSRREGKATQFDINANLVGDSSQLFELPGGPVRFAIGGEYRRETASYRYDDLVKSGATFLNAIPDFDPTSFEVKEAYGEIELPVLRELPFAQELTINAAARVADYKGSTGTVWAWNAGGIYAPIRDIKFRVNYSKSVRAPTLGDLYSSPSQNFASVDDPCDVNFINNGPNRAANCLAAGVPVGFANDVVRAGTLEILSGGNANLTAETSRSWTYGVIVQPRFLPGFAITADYYDIEINNVISSVDAQQILDACYDADSLNNQFCGFINPRESNGYFARPALLQSSVNFSALRAKGIDVDMSYTHRFDADNRLAVRLIGTWVENRTDYPYLDDPDFPERELGELGDPIWSANATVDYSHGPFSLGYQLRYVGKQSITDWEAQHDYNGVPAYDPNYADVVYYPEVFYHSIRATMDVNRQFTLYGGIDNLTDERPPYGLLGNGEDAIYDNVGRFMYIGATVKF